MSEKKQRIIRVAGAVVLLLLGTHSTMLQARIWGKVVVEEEVVTQLVEKPKKLTEPTTELKEETEELPTTKLIAVQEPSTSPKAKRKKRVFKRRRPAPKKTVEEVVKTQLVEKPSEPTTKLKEEVEELPTTELKAVQEPSTSPKAKRKKRVFKRRRPVSKQPTSKAYQEVVSKLPNYSKRKVASEVLINDLEKLKEPTQIAFITRILAWRLAEEKEKITNEQATRTVNVLKDTVWPTTRKEGINLVKVDAFISFLTVAKQKKIGNAQKINVLLEELKKVKEGLLKQ